MPLSFRTNKTIDISLDIDADLPERDRPAFICRFVSEADAQRMEEIARTGIDATDDTDSNRYIREAVAVAIVGWKNMPTEAGPWQGADSLRTLTVAELVELHRKVWSRTTANGPLSASTSA